ncbi:MAG: hypothetical protein M3P18_04995 [Actinomycetota bacterium]|nr:hypothetical protein [Actinomycetota bacterium]
MTTAKAPHGQKTIKVKVVFWTDNIASEPGAIEPGHAWYSGMAHIEANPAHGIRSQPNPVPFNNPDELREAIEASLRISGVSIHDPKTAEVMKL